MLQENVDTLKKNIKAFSSSIVSIRSMDLKYLLFQAMSSGEENQERHSKQKHGMKNKE